MGILKKLFIKIFGKFEYLLVNNNIMGQRIILSEDEKLNIQKMYGLINEQEQDKPDITSQLKGMLEGGQIDDKTLEGIIPNLTEEIINNVAGGNLIEKLLTKGVSCDLLLKIFDMFPSDNHAVSLSKKGEECGSNDMYYYVNEKTPSRFLRYVRAVYGKHLNNIINNNDIGSPIKEIFQIINEDSVNDISMLEKILRKYNDDTIVQAVNDIEDKGARREVVMMLKILYHYLGIDTYISLDGIKLQGF